VILRTWIGTDLSICSCLKWNVDDANQNVIYMEVYDWPLSGCSLSIRTVNRLGEAASGLLSDVAASKSREYDQSNFPSSFLRSFS
jgi:hypothetical protein